MEEGQNKFFAGTDSAPHTTKATACGCAAGCCHGRLLHRSCMRWRSRTRAWTWEARTGSGSKRFLSLNGPAFDGFPASEHRFQMEKAPSQTSDARHVCGSSDATAAGHGLRSHLADHWVRSVTTKELLILHARSVQFCPSHAHLSRMKLSLSLRLAAVSVAVAITGQTWAADLSLPRSTPEAEGISSGAVRSFIEAADQQIHTLHSFMLVRHGKVIAEAWWKPEAADKKHILWSLSKSFTSTAVGLAAAGRKAQSAGPGAEVFQRRGPGRAERKFEGHACARSAYDERWARCGAEVCLRRWPLGEGLPGASRGAQAGHLVPLQYTQHLHGLGHRHQGDGADRANLLKASVVPATRD